MRHALGNPQNLVFSQGRQVHRLKTLLSSGISEVVGRTSEDHSREHIVADGHCLRRICITYDNSQLKEIEFGDIDSPTGKGGETITNTSV